MNPLAAVSGDEDSRDHADDPDPVQDARLGTAEKPLKADTFEIVRIHSPVVIRECYYDCFIIFSVVLSCVRAHMRLSGLGVYRSVGAIQGGRFTYFSLSWVV